MRALVGPRDRHYKEPIPSASSRDKALSTFRTYNAPLKKALILPNEAPYN